MKILSAFTSGIRRINGAKKYIVMVYIINLAIGVIFACSMAMILGSSFGSSLAGENMRQGFDDFWYSSFSAEANGLEAVFDPGVTQFGAVLKGLDAFLTGNILAGFPAIVGAGLLYLVMWTFFSGGFIAVYASGEERPSFFHKAAVFFPRIFILTVLAGILYFLLFYFVADRLGEWVAEQTRETIDERVHFAYVMVKYAVVWCLLLLINILFDYSKILTVLQDHKNVFTAPFKAIGRSLVVVFVHFPKTFGLYLLIGIVWIAFAFVYWLIVPGASDSTWIGVFWVFLIGQIYLISRIWTRCLFYAGQTAMGSAINSPNE